MSELFPSNRKEYLQLLRAELPRYDELEDASVSAIPFPPQRVLELGIGTGETTRRILDAYPTAQVTGLDSDSAMVFRAREMDIEVRLARMEDPLPDGPWDLVISVLSVHHLTSEQKRDLFRRLREQSSAFVMGGVVKAEPQITEADEGVDFFDPPQGLAEWCGGELVWSADDLAVIAADYR